MGRFYTSVYLLLFSYAATVQSAHFKVTSQINLDITIDKEFIGTITIGLFGDDSPKTVANFREICINGINGKTYVGTKFHRVIDKFIIQGGDIVSNDGRGSVSIYGKYFEDENLTVNHTGPGFIGMGAAYVHVIEKTKTEPYSHPVKEIMITKCSDEPLSKSYYISDNPYDLYSWIRASAAPLGFSFAVLGFFGIIIRKLDKIEKQNDADDQKTE